NGQYEAIDIGHDVSPVGLRLHQRRAAGRSFDRGGRFSSRESTKWQAGLLRSSVPFRSCLWIEAEAQLRHLDRQHWTWHTKCGLTQAGVPATQSHVSVQIGNVTPCLCACSDHERVHGPIIPGMWTISEKKDLRTLRIVAEQYERAN